MKSTTILIATDMTSAHRKEIKEEFDRRINAGYDEILLDFENIQFIDSTGIGLLLQLYNTLKSRNGTVRVLHANENIVEMFKILRLDMQIDIVV